MPTASPAVPSYGISVTLGPNTSCSWTSVAARASAAKSSVGATKKPRSFSIPSRRFGRSTPPVTSDTRSLDRSFWMPPRTSRS